MVFEEMGRDNKKYFIYRSITTNSYNFIHLIKVGKKSTCFLQKVIFQRASLSQSSFHKFLGLSIIIIETDPVELSMYTVYTV